MGVSSLNHLANGSIAVIFCLAIVLGLLSTIVPWGGWGVAVLALSVALILPRYWRRGPKRPIWLLIGAVSLLASGYFYLRIPQPAQTDISQFLPPIGQQTVVVGTVQSKPYLTRSGKVQLWLAATQLGDAVQGMQRRANQAVTGKLYVTLPPGNAIRLQPGQSLGIIGSLYRPQAATNPYTFDFKEYLAESGSFAGLRGCRIFDAPAFMAQGGDLSSIRDCEAANLPALKPEPHWGWWTIQERIARSQARWLDKTEAALVTAMVLGSKAVDLPFEVKDTFLQVGLAAALAASGFQISLILGVVLGLTQRYARWIQVTAGALSIVIFVGLAGGQPSVLRAAVMGLAGLTGILMQRKVRPVGALLLTTVVLLFWNPLWIWDLGFELSVLATLGLLVTAPTLTKWLDWLPPAIASLIAVPIAAYLWTLPVQLAAFGVLSPYSIPANILTTPFISVISIGGMISALAAILWVPAGSALAYLLHYPTLALITIVKGFSQLPGSAYASGSVSPLILVTLYVLIGLTWLTAWWRRRWWVALFLGVILTLIPLWQRQVTAVETTILATNKEPVMVIRSRGKTLLLNSGDAATARYTLLPLLQKAGVNQIDWGVATSQNNDGWSTLQQFLPVRAVYTSNNSSASQSFTPLKTGQPLQLGEIPFTLYQQKPLVATFQIQGQAWLWLGSLKPEQQRKWLQTASLPKVDVLWWSGRSLAPALVQTVHPKLAIASGRTLDSETANSLQKIGAQTYWTKRDGGIRWSPQGGIQTTLTEDAQTPAL